ncbi:hypothetical protein V6Z11_D11G286600 [Gossypium hirsutum]
MNKTLFSGTKPWYWKRVARPDTFHNIFSISILTYQKKEVS